MKKQRAAEVMAALLAYDAAMLGKPLFNLGARIAAMHAALEAAELERAKRCATRDDTATK